LAVKAERERRRQLEEGVNHLKAEKGPMIFSVYAKQYLEANTPHWSAGTLEIQERVIGHLTNFNKLLLTDITSAGIARHQTARKRAGACGRSINMEIGALRAILRSIGYGLTYSRTQKCYRSGQTLAAHYHGMKRRACWRLAVRAATGAYTLPFCCPFTAAFAIRSFACCAGGKSTCWSVPSPSASRKRLAAKAALCL
jgi:hypothetical protein